jgi:hypothetical protein
MQCSLTGSSTIGSWQKLTIFQEDADKVFGVSSTGKEVFDASLDKSQGMCTKVENLLGMDDKVPFVVYVVTILVDSKTPYLTLRSW